jgi:hypothetical protein
MENSEEASSGEGLKMRRGAFCLRDRHLYHTHEENSECARTGLSARSLVDGLRGSGYRRSQRQRGLVLAENTSVTVV